MLNAEYKRLHERRNDIEQEQPEKDLRLTHVLLYMLPNMGQTEEERLVKSLLLTEQFLYFPKFDNHE